MSVTTIQSNISLQPLNTLSVPATARYFTTVRDLADLYSALAHANAEHLAVMVIGGGSNIVLQDDFSGLVIHLQTHGIEVSSETETHINIAVAAGENWHQLVSRCLERGWYGLENLALIPGTVGAAPVQNIGAYGVELADMFVELEAINIVTGKTRVFNKSECLFGYRQSYFKTEGLGRYVISRVHLRLSKQPELRVSYPGLQQVLCEHLALADDQLVLAILDGQVTPVHVFDAVCALRKLKLPDPSTIPNAGSFFKNPVVDAKLAARLLTQFPGLVSYPATDGVKLAAGWLIEQAGWKGFNADGRNLYSAGVHARQALVLVNPNHVSGAEVLALAHKIQSSVADMFDVHLEIEPFIVSS